MMNANNCANQLSTSKITTWVGDLIRYRVSEASFHVWLTGQGSQHIMVGSAWLSSH